MKAPGAAALFFGSPLFFIGAGLLAMGLMFVVLGFVYEDPRFEEAGVVQNLRINAWKSMNSGGVAGYIEIHVLDTGGPRRWTLPLRVALQHKERLAAMQGKYVKALVAGEQAKEILQLTQEGMTVIPLEESLKYKAQGRAWFGWGGLVGMLAGALLWLKQLLAVRKTVVSLKMEPT